MKWLLDTSVYLEAMRSDAGRQAFERRFFPLLFNRDDFKLIRRYRQFALEVLTPGNW